LGPAKPADQNGIDPRIARAAVETIPLALGADYDRSVLIPEVTRFARSL
jgi:hypothetical protein